VQGWSSDRFNFKTPASCTIFMQQVVKPVTNVWLIAPSDESSAEPSLAVTFSPGGQLIIRTRFANVEEELQLDPERPEETLRSRSR
jgi:hypothetical protein